MQITKEANLVILKFPTFFMGGCYPQEVRMYIVYTGLLKARPGLVQLRESF